MKSTSVPDWIEERSSEIPVAPSSLFLNAQGDLSGTKRESSDRIAAEHTSPFTTVRQEQHKDNSIIAEADPGHALHLPPWELKEKDP